MRTTKQIFKYSAAALLGLGLANSPAHAISITPNASALDLVNALTAGGGTGINVTSFSLSGNSLPTGEVSTGTFTNTSGTYGVGSGIVLSTGDVADYEDGPNVSPSNTTGYEVPATAAQETLLDPITGGGFTHFDVTQLDVNFDLLPGFDTVFFNVVFGSEEFPEFVGSTFIDGFGLYVNGTNIANVGGLPVNINHPDFAPVPGTELDGILAPGGNPVVTFSQFIGDGSIGNTLTFIIADTSDTQLDTTTYISALGGTPPTDVPEPASILGLLAFGAFGAGSALKRKQKQPA